MALVLNEEQNMLKDAAKDFCGAYSDTFANIHCAETNVFEPADDGCFSF